MLKFKIEIDCDNDSFFEIGGPRSNESAGSEVRAILARLITRNDLRSDGPWSLFDENGNKVGKAGFVEKRMIPR